MTKNVFITGGSGQDGQILINILKKKKINLTVISKTKKLKTSSNVSFVKENYTNMRGTPKIIISVNDIIFFFLIVQFEFYASKLNMSK